MTMNKIPITVRIMTLNAGRHLDELFDSVLPFVEDVFVIDSFSLDDTIDICLRRGVKVVQRHYVNSSDQISWAIRNLPYKTDWVFGLAQDERFTPSLVKELRDLFARGIPDDVDGFTIRWRLWFMGEPLHAVSDNLRIMRLAKCGVTNVACNEHYFVKGRVLHLKGILEHKDTLNLHEWYEKQNLWTTREAIQRVKPPSEDELPKLLGTRRQRKAWVKQMMIHMPLGGMVLFWYYLLKFGAWRDGAAGWTWARLRVWVHQVTTLKEREMRLYGVPTVIPEGRHGTYDERVLKSELQRRLLPESLAALI